jgi:DNA-binding MarR family transcriptional regulator
VSLNNPPPTDRRHVADELLDELTVWAPRERRDAFRAWLRGSLSLIHLHVLTILEDGPLSMSHLAQGLDVSVASATGIVDRMEERKLVARRSHPDDRRVVIVQVTRRGSTVFRALARDRRARLAPIIERMTDDEVSSFLVGLRAMRRIRTELADRGAVAR